MDHNPLTDPVAKMLTSTVETVAQNNPAPCRAVAMECIKCGVTLTIKPSNPSDEYRLFNTPDFEGIDWRRFGIEDFFVCPFCLYRRGGNYPLTHIVSDTEKAALAAYKAAARAYFSMPEPAGLMPDVGDEHPAMRAWEEAWEAYDAVYAEYTAAERHLNEFLPVSVVGLPFTWEA